MNVSQTRFCFSSPQHIMTPLHTTKAAAFLSLAPAFSFRKAFCYSFFKPTGIHSLLSLTRPITTSCSAFSNTRHFSSRCFYLFHASMSANRKRSRTDYDSDASDDTVASEANNQVQAIDNNDPTLVSTTPYQPFKVKRLSKKARLPKRGSSLAAGYDICSARQMKIPPKGKALVPTDLAMQIPLGTYGRIAPRSGLAVRKFIDVGAGVIDADYRGPLQILLFNFGDETFEINEGDRIAQMVLERIITPDVEEVEELDDTDRGENGFGSTGVKTTE
ncbi:dUTPase-like protein [Syncephalis fuscata]|nr:dUTPase-like protein [Syncephalis fuscata]